MVPRLRATSGPLRRPEEGMTRSEVRLRPRRRGALAVAIAVAVFVSGCTMLGTVCAPGMWAPTTAEVAWSPGPYGTGLVPAVGGETAQRSAAPPPSPGAEAPAATPKAPVSETEPK